LICGGCITISFNVAAIAAAIPAISLDLNVPALMVSKMIPFYMIPYGIGALAYAPLTRKVSYKVILATSLALYSVACFSCASATSINQLLFGRFVMGISAGGAIPLGLMLIGQLFRKEIRGRLVGLFFSGSFFASVFGIIVAGVAQWRLLFMIPVVLAAITSLSIALFQSDLLRRVHGANVNYITTLKNKDIQRVFIFIFAISFLYHSVHKWFGIYLDKIYDLDKFVISMFFIILSVGGFAGQNIGGFISDKKGRYLACLAGVLILSVATMSLYGKYPLPVLAILLGLVGMGWTIGHNGISTILTDFPEKHRPAIASLNSSVRFVSGGVGFYISRIFVEKGFNVTFFGIGILMFISAFFIKKIIPEFEGVSKNSTLSS